MKGADAARVLCVGVNPAFDLTLTLDGLDRDRVNRVVQEHRQAAGKAANVAFRLAQKGIKTALAGIYGEENAAEWSALFKQRTGGRVDQLTVTCPGQTRQNMTLLAGGDTVKINQPGCAVSGACVAALSEAITGHTRAGDIAVFTGSLPQGMTFAQYVRLMQQTGRRGCRVAVDNDGISREELLSVRPWLYKPNAHELAKMCCVSPDDDRALIAEAQKLAQQGVEIVLLTLGSRGLAAVTKDQTVRVEPEPIEPVNTVGAGDAALAAFVASALAGNPLEECARAAARAGEQAALERY